MNRTRQLEQLRRNGETARRALSELAMSKSDASACALGFLCELRDPSDSTTGEIVSATLVGPVAEANERRYRSQIVALNCVAQFGVSYPGIVGHVSAFVGQGGALEQVAIDALGRIQEPDAGVVLRELLDGLTTGSTAHPHNVIASIGQRRDREAVDKLRLLAHEVEFDDDMYFQIALALSRIAPLENAKEILESIARMERTRRVEGLMVDITNELRGRRREIANAGLGRELKMIDDLIREVEELIHLEH